MSIYQMAATEVKHADTIKMLLQLEFNISEITAGLLINRGIESVEEARVFLNPSLDQLHNPFELASMDRAVERICQAAASGEKITIYGDYDADGITSASILSLYLKTLGANVNVYIPSRQDEGYGLHLDALMSLKEDGTRLLITVDCGITAIDEVKEMLPYMDIIITDHHTPDSELPEAYAVINPKISGQAYPYKDLAGVGVAAKLIQALGGPDALKPYLDLIAVGTIADIVPLTGENRVFAALGIRQINQGKLPYLRPGIAALLQVLEIDAGVVDSAKVSFSIAPCLNAPGRMTTFHSGYELLTAPSLEEAIPAAVELVQQNKLRKETEQEILECARQAIAQQVDLAHDRIIIISGDGWHPGVIGIVASRITELYHRPCVIISLAEENGVGSGRSVKGFNLYQALSTCKDLFIRFGGHEQAAGLSIRKEDIPEFRKRICDYARYTIDDSTLIPHFTYDDQITTENVSPNLINEIEMLAPFGFGNPSPRFLVQSAIVESSRLIGRESNHIKLALAIGQRSWDAIGFGMGRSYKDLQQGSKISLLTSLKKNEWMGISNTQFQIHSMKRIFQDQNDLKDLLGDFYFKIFDVFLSDFMYNDNVAIEYTADAYANDQYEIITADEAAELLNSSMVGTGILVNTLESAACILEKLLDKGMLDRIPAGYHRPNPADGVGRSAVILAPDSRYVPEKYYHTLVMPVLEKQFHFGSQGRRIQSPKVKYLFSLDGNNAHITLKEILQNSFTLSRDQMGIVYKWLRRIVPGRNYWPDTGHLLLHFRESTGTRLNGFQLRMALEVFKELEFITLETGNTGCQDVKLHCHRNPVSRQLDESRLYTYHKEWLSRYGIG